MKQHRQIQISIIGLGVIGGSLALAIKQNCENASITGFDHSEQIAQALERNAIDYGALSLRAAVADADVVFICTPVSIIKKYIPLIASSVKENTIVTDVGSTKNEITALAKKYFTKNKYFAGGHPMTGSEGKGIEFADALLFQNAAYVLCAEKNIRQKIKPLTDILHSIGARILFLSAKEHDEVAAGISHLPQLIAVAMMEIIGAKNKKNPAFFQLAAGGFRDITRIASSPYGMWSDILESNKNEIHSAVKKFASLLLQYSDDVLSARKKFEKRFLSAKTLRDAIPKNSKGFLHPLFDIYVSVEDKQGVLAQLTAALFNAKINIKDIELLKIRDGRGGTFRLSFDSTHDAEKAKKVLRKEAIRVL